MGRLDKILAVILKNQVVQRVGKNQQTNDEGYLSHQMIKHGEGVSKHEIKGRTEFKEKSNGFN